MFAFVNRVNNKLGKANPGWCVFQRNAKARESAVIPTVNNYHIIELSN